MTRDILITVAKMLATIALVVLMMMWWTAEINRAMAASLRLNPVIQGDHIRLGDVFDGVGSHANHALAPAPKPGEELVWNARTLTRIAVAFDLNWRPESTAQSVSIRRTGIVLPHDVIEETLLQALYEREGLHERFALSLEQDPGIILPDGAETGLSIITLHYDPFSRVVDAVVSPADPLVDGQYRLRGRLQQIVAVPVLRSTLRKGEVIGEYDIEWVDMKHAQIRPDMVVSAEDIVGMTPRRFVTIGQPVRFSDLDKPKLVKRGEPVTIVYNNGRIQLTAQGRALENGTKDMVIEVANRSSNRTLQAVVTGTREVTILQ